jgi:D-glycero-alpha-D-manno-heptose-7-phosphate kinase
MCAISPGSSITSTELSYAKIERVTDVDQINHPAVRNAMKMLDMHEIRLTYEADLPGA